MKKDSFTIYDGEYVCLIRTRCTRVDFCKISNMIKKQLDFNLDDSSIVSFLLYNGTAFSVEKMLDKNLGIKNFAIDSDFVKSVTKKEFINNREHRFIFEVIIDETCDVSDLHYLLLLLKYLEFTNEKYNVLISSTRTDVNRYSAIEDSDYFKISYLLFFYGKMYDEISDICNVFEKTRAYCNIPSTVHNSEGKSIKVDDVKWRRLASNYEKQPQAGKVVPVIPITKESFSALITDYFAINDETFILRPWNSCIFSLCNDYIKRIDKIDSSILSNGVFDLLNSDNCLEALIFLSTLYYIILEDKDDFYQISNLMSLSNIHESCTDYSQGIIQLIENVVNHVIGENNDAGCGVLSIRFRTKDDAKDLYVLDESAFSDVNYFMEVYLTDFQFNDFEGIVGKFYNNVKKRLMKNINNEKEFLINSKFYFSQMENIDEINRFAGGVTQNIVKEIETYINDVKNTTKSKVNLEDMFLNESNKPLKDYLSSSENVAFHYGLQILNSVISVADGYLYVKSGEGLLNAFSNNHTKKYKDMPALEYDFGTMYVINIPLRLKDNINYLDSIAVSNSVICQKCNYINIDTKNNMEYDDKETATKCFYEAIKARFNSNMFLEECTNIGIIDFDKIFNLSNHSKTYIYEIVAKALFLYLVNEESRVDNIALVNAEDKYDVIKIFRQFALFFDRNGYNKLIKKTKSVFIVDQNGETDILFHGNTIKSISESLSLSQLYGGTDERAMEIIKCLVRDGHE